MEELANAERRILTLIVPRAWEIGYTQPCIKFWGKSATHFVYFEVIRGLFLFQGPIGREIRTTMRIRWSFAQMCCTISLVCPLIATHRICQFWAHSEPINMPKTIRVSCQMWNACCNSFPLFQNKQWGMLSSGIVLLHDNARPHNAAATKRLLKRFRWEVFDHPPSSTRTWLPVIFISFLVWNSHRRTTFWHRAADQHRELAESTGSWLLQSHSFNTLGNRRLPLAALAGRPAAWRDLTLPLLPTLTLFFSSVFDNWSRASKYIYTAETLVFTNCDYC